MNMYLPYLNSYFDIMESAEKSWDEKIKELKREYYRVTPNLPRKLKKKRRKELNEEYSLLMSIKEYRTNMFTY